MKIILFFCLFLYFSTVSSQLEIDGIIEFVQGPANFRTFCTENGIDDVHIKNSLSQFYGLSLGVLYRLKRDWHCENANEKAPKWFDQEKCKYFGKCLAVLYEYLANVHAGHEITRPVFNKRYGITFAEVLDRLAWICNNFLIDSKLINEENAQKLKETFEFVEFNLTNEVKYETNAESAKEAANFDKKLAKMYKKAKEWVKLEKGSKTGKMPRVFMTSF